MSQLLAHVAHAPVQPMTLSVLQRGHRISGDSKPHDGHLGMMAMVPSLLYAIRRMWAMMPPSRNASVSEPASKPTM